MTKVLCHLIPGLTRARKQADILDHACRVAREFRDDPIYRARFTHELQRVVGEFTSNITEELWRMDSRIRLLRRSSWILATLSVALFVMAVAMIPEVELDVWGTVVWICAIASLGYIVAALVLALYLSELQHQWTYESDDCFDSSGGLYLMERATLLFVEAIHSATMISVAFIVICYIILLWKGAVI